MKLITSVFTKFVRDTRLIDPRIFEKWSANLQLSTSVILQTRQCDASCSLWHRLLLVVFCLENVHENGKRRVRRPGISLDAYLDRQKIDTAWFTRVYLLDSSSMPISFSSSPRGFLFTGDSPCPLSGVGELVLKDITNKSKQASKVLVVKTLLTSKVRISFIFNPKSAFGGAVVADTIGTHAWCANVNDVKRSFSSWSPQRHCGFVWLTRR